MGKIVSALKEQGKAVLVMMSLALVAVLAIIMLGLFNTSIPGNVATTTVNTTITLFIAAFALFGSFASITALVILIKAIVGVVRGLS